MADIEFDVPDHIKEAFEEAIPEEDRNATISRLMQEAVEERRRQQRRADIEAAWRQEVADRVAAVDRGAVEMTSWQEIRGRFLVRLSKRRPE